MNFYKVLYMYWKNVTFVMLNCMCMIQRYSSIYY